MASNRRSAELLAGSVTALVDATTRHMPSGPYRDFTAWALAGENPHQHDYLQAIGLTQLVRMNATLLSGLIDDDGWPTMVRCASLMNAYQIFEVVSDNLAIGLGERDLDPAAVERLGLVTSLNRAMLRTLTPGRREPAVLLLGGMARDNSRRISGFGQSLAPDKHATIADSYTHWLLDSGRKPPPLEELEYGLWSALVANVETCRDLVDVLAETATAPLLRHGLADRYRAVDRTLRAEHLPRLELATLGSQSILVAPTLAYFAAVLTELIRPSAAYPRLVADGTLHDVLADAALLVRLQNDIGTRLLRMAPVRHTALMHRFIRSCEEAGCVTAADALGLLATQFTDDPCFTRLHKDLANGESNVALWHARRAGDAEAAALALTDSLAFFSGLYVLHSARLAGGLAELDARLGDRRVSTCIERFVRFHEQMYAHKHTERVGEYAI